MEHVDSSPSAATRGPGPSTMRTSLLVVPRLGREIRPGLSTLGGRKLFGEEGQCPLAGLSVGQRNGKGEHWKEEPPHHAIIPRGSP